MPNTLRSLDLNLLLVLKELADDPHVTRAAAKLGLTQSAVSHALNRLRAHFGEALFVRTAKGLEPTAFVLSMRGDLNALAACMDKIATHNVAFDPATSHRAFTIGMLELVSIPCIPRLMRHMAKVAPNVVLNFRAVSPDSGPEALENRDIDLYVGYTGPKTQSLKMQMLYRDDFVCVMGKSHPLAKKKRLSKDDYIQARHMKLSLQGDRPSYVDQALAKNGITRKHALTLPYYLLGFDVLRHTQVVTSVTRALVLYALREFFDAKQYRVVPFPFPIDPMPILQIWHARAAGDAGHQWLRQTMKKIGDDIARDLGRSLA